MTFTIQEGLVYQVISNSDTNEGRGQTVSLGWYTTNFEALRAAKGQGVMGTDAVVTPCYTRTVRLENDRVFLVGEEVKSSYVDLEDIRQSALSKLTLEERAVLGV